MLPCNISLHACFFGGCLCCKTAFGYLFAFAVNHAGFKRVIPFFSTFTGTDCWCFFHDMPPNHQKAKPQCWQVDMMNV